MRDEVVSGWLLVAGCWLIVFFLLISHVRQFKRRQTTAQRPTNHQPPTTN